MRRTKTRLSVWISLSACIALAGCSHSSSPSSATSHSDGGTPPAKAAATTISSAQVTGLQAVVASAHPDASVPEDNETAHAAAQIADLDLDRASSVFAANALEVAEQDPAR